ncbi:phage major capsid protein, P2 family [Luteibacter sp. NPDC031894]|uniref:phage major capsid protein, P2 family n=1 Tax=Luteibacter sp. NPDC031894 TaxID=3390572 RepID=UPI003CFBFF6A
MRNDTRKKYNQYLARIAELNAVDSAGQQFSVDPSVQQKLETAIQEKSDFLSLINIVPVDEMKGEKLGLGVSGPVSGRTNTSANKARQPRDVGTLDQRGYECAQTNFDTFIKYATLDQWAKFPDFQTRLSGAIVQRQSLDRITIGFNGTSVAVDSDLDANPLLQDVNIGWLQHIRTEAPSRWMHQVGSTGKIRVGPGGDYENLDALVMDMNELLEPWYRGTPGLRAIVGRSLVHDKYFPIVNREQGAQDELASQVLVSQKSIGGNVAISVPFFPANSILLTAPDNLSIYYQDGKRRRFVKEEPELNRISNYESSNDAYVVEDLNGAALVENIEFGNWKDAP